MAPKMTIFAEKNGQFLSPLQCRPPLSLWALSIKCSRACVPMCTCDGLPSSTQINYDLFDGLLEYFHRESPTFDAGPSQKGAVLIFLPGLAEIQRAFDRVTDLSQRGTAGALWPVPVHGTLTSAEQQKVLVKTRKNPKP